MMALQDKRLRHSNWFREEASTPIRVRKMTEEEKRDLERKLNKNKYNPHLK